MYIVYTYIHGGCLHICIREQPQGEKSVVRHVVLYKTGHVNNCANYYLDGGCQAWRRRKGRKLYVYIARFSLLCCNKFKLATLYLPEAIMKKKKKIALPACWNFFFPTLNNYCFYILFLSLLHSLTNIYIHINTRTFSCNIFSNKFLGSKQKKVVKIQSIFLLIIIKFINYYFAFHNTNCYEQII